MKDVNNYLITKPDGSIKAKGKFLNENNHRESLEKALFNPVCAIAIRKFILDGTPVRDTLMAHYSEPDGVYDFCRAAKVGKQYNVVYETIERGTREIVSAKTGKLLKPRPYVDVLDHTVEQNSVRYYVAKTGKRLRKRHKELNAKGEVAYLEFVVGYDTHLFNDFSEDRPDPDWDYYEKYCYDIISKFKKIEL